MYRDYEVLDINGKWVRTITAKSRRTAQNMLERQILSAHIYNNKKSLELNMDKIGKCLGANK